MRAGSALERLWQEARHDAYAFAVIARLRNGATIATARAELTRLAADLDPAHPNNGYRALVSTAITLLDATVGRTAATLWTLLAAVGLVMLVACANVANLFLVRSDAKQREIATRRALGAGNRAIVHYFLTESTLLCLAGGAIGLVLSWSAVRMVVAFGPVNLPRLNEVRLDATTSAFTFIVSLAMASALGFIPLIRFTPTMRSLHQGGRGNATIHGRHRARHVLMAVEVALAMVLVAASGLLLRSFHKMRAVDPGFDPTSALTFRIGLPRTDYPTREKMVAAHRNIVDGLSTLPGVSAVAASTCLPLSEQQLCQGGPLFIEGHPLPPGAIAPFVAIRAVDGGYFETMRTRVLRGRGIHRSDVLREEPIAVINQALVNVAFPREDPIGKRVRFGNPALAPAATEWLTVAGVVGNTPIFGLAEANPFPQLYVPIFASRSMNMAPRLDAMSYVVRTELTPASFAQPVGRAIGQVDSNLAFDQVRTLQEILDRAASPLAFAMVLLAIAAGVSLTLGVIGIYGAMSYIVAQRTGEIGVRLALGAEPRSIARMVLGYGGGVALAGIGGGLAIALAAGRFIESLLYGVTSRDPVVLSVTAAILLSVILVACWLPARRAARLSPLEALRNE